MRKFWALLWSSMSALMGLLRVWPSVPDYPRQNLALAQTVATEDPGFGVLLGLVGVWTGLRARSRRAILLGLAGIALGLRHLVRRGVVSDTLSDAMREGLGMGWQQTLPSEVHRAFSQRHRTDLSGTLRGLLLRRVRITRDVLFAAPDGAALRLDIYQPDLAQSPETAEGRPAVIVVHGGSWFYGNKGDYALGLHNNWLATQGMVVFDIQYRLGASWPAPLADVKCAICWVKVNAARYGVDPNRIALLGRSAGAHLALMAAYTANDPKFPSSCFSGESSKRIDERVQAVMAAGAPADLRLMAADPDGAVVRLLGGLPDHLPKVYADASPVTHIRPGLPPTLLIQGQRDRSVPPGHAELLANELRSVGVTTVLLRIPWGRHGADAFPIGLSAPAIQYDIDRFLAWVFYRPTSPAGTDSGHAPVTPGG